MNIPSYTRKEVQIVASVIRLGYNESTAGAAWMDTHGGMPATTVVRLLWATGEEPSPQAGIKPCHQQLQQTLHRRRNAGFTSRKVSRASISTMKRWYKTPALIDKWRGFFHLPIRTNSYQFVPNEKSRGRVLVGKIQVW